MAQGRDSRRAHLRLVPPLHLQEAPQEALQAPQAPQVALEALLRELEESVQAQVLELAQVEAQVLQQAERQAKVLAQVESQEQVEE